MSVALDRWICLEIRACQPLFNLVQRTHPPWPNGLAGSERPAASRPPIDFSISWPTKNDRARPGPLRAGRFPAFSATEARWRGFLAAFGPSVIRTAISSLEALCSYHKTRLQPSVYQRVSCLNNDPGIGARTHDSILRDQGIRRMRASPVNRKTPDSVESAR